MNPTNSPDRDSRIDVLRGLVLVIMTSDHLPDNPLFSLGWQTFGYVSAAEGFVFLSGLVTGWVYGKVLLRRGKDALRHRAWRRAQDIYLTQLVSLTAVLVLSGYGEHPLVAGFASFWDAWWRGAAMLYQPYLFGILPMYTIFLLLTPLVVRQMAEGRSRFVLAVSFALWTAAQFGIGTPPHDRHALNQIGYFNILAWQLLFVGGTYLGLHKAERRKLPIPSSRVLCLVSIACATVLLLLRHHLTPLGRMDLVDNTAALGAWRATLHPIRLLDFAVFAYLAWYVPRWVDECCENFLTIRFLRYIGRHSLQVFAWTILVTYMVLGERGQWGAMAPQSRVLLALCACLSLVVPAWMHQQWRLYRQRQPAAPIPAEA